MRPHGQPQVGAVEEYEDAGPRLDDGVRPDDEAAKSGCGDSEERRARTKATEAAYPTAPATAATGIDQRSSAPTAVAIIPPAPKRVRAAARAVVENRPPESMSKKPSKISSARKETSMSPNPTAARTMYRVIFGGPLMP